MYPGDVVLLTFRPKIREHVIFNEHKLVEFLPVEYEPDYSTVQAIDVQECRETAAIRGTPELVPL